MAINPLISIPSFVVTLAILLVFTAIVFLRKFKILSGKIFTFHLIVKAIWFTGIFLTGFGDYNLVNLGAILFLIGGWGLGFTMSFFLMSILKSSTETKKYLGIASIITAVYFASFLLIPAYTLLPEEGGGYYFKLENYFLIPALLLSCSYYATVIMFYIISKNKDEQTKKYYRLFSLGLLIHSIPAHTLVILEFFFGFRFLIINLEYFSMIGFSLALYSYFKAFSKKE